MALLDELREGDLVQVHTCDEDDGRTMRCTSVLYGRITEASERTLCVDGFIVATRECKHEEWKYVSTVTAIFRHCPEPTEPGWYYLEGTTGTSIYLLRAGGDWFAFSDNGTSTQCSWDYIEQCSGVFRVKRLDTKGGTNG